MYKPENLVVNSLYGMGNGERVGILSHVKDSSTGYTIPPPSRMVRKSLVVMGLSGIGVLNSNPIPPMRQNTAKETS